MSLQAMKSNDDKNKMIKIKLKDKDINNDDIIEKEANIKDKVEKEEEIDENFHNNEVKKRRKSVVALTVPNYQNINNVNDYILNYDNSKKIMKTKKIKNIKRTKNIKKIKNLKKIKNIKKLKKRMKIKNLNKIKQIKKIKKIKIINYQIVSLNLVKIINKK